MKKTRTIKVICNCDIIFMRIRRENVLNFPYCNASGCFNFKVLAITTLLLLLFNNYFYLNQHKGRDMFP